MSRRGRSAVTRVASATIGLSLVIGLAALAGPRATEAAYPGDNGDIVFASTRATGSGVHIFRMEADGTGVVQLTFGSTIDLEPVFSPGGTKVAFTRYTTATSPGEIYVMDANGSNVRRVTNHPADDWSPSWTADGHRIFFTSDRHLPTGTTVADDYDIYVMDRDGKNVQTAAASPGWDAYVVGAPHDPTGFMFSSDRGGYPRLYWSQYPEERTLQQMPTHAYAFDSDYHPSGTRRIIFESWLYDFENLFFHSPAVYHSSAQDVLSAVTPREWAIGPVFSPDGTKILYSSPVNDPNPDDAFAIYDIYVKDGTTGPVMRLTTSTSSWSIDPNWQPIPEFPLVDATFHLMNLDIRWLFESGITTGCEAELFCPNANVTRGQMSAFLARAFDLPAATKDHFTDDETSIFEDAINRVADAGITTGCGGTAYCPLALVTRAEMAAFITRAQNLPPATMDHFSDDDGHLLEDAINRFAEAGITTGCRPANFCPTNPVTRGQMAAFLHRALE